ncbi:MAG: hypothetical protein CMI54_04965 [Parcubacteria group bacterium]|nr:hypothetical protein [Parcubacteria group bacterium]|tara:strand:+ start:632 stop:892 length:261 start_codon:yes stop_codon:yes gene_type:complete
MSDSMFQIKVVDVIENEDGSAEVEFNVSEEFINWFKEKEGLKRWSQKRFEKWFAKAMKESLKNVEEQKRLQHLRDLAKYESIAASQ